MDTLTPARRLRLNHANDDGVVFPDTLAPGATLQDLQVDKSYSPFFGRARSLALWTERGIARHTEMTPNKPHPGMVELTIPSTVADSTMIGLGLYHHDGDASASHLTRPADALIEAAQRALKLAPV